MASVGELRAMDAKELSRELEDLLSEQFKLRMQMGSGQEVRPHFFGRVRGDIARVHCIIGERERGVAASKGAAAPAKQSRAEREASAASAVDLLAAPQDEAATGEPAAVAAAAEKSTPAKAAPAKAAPAKAAPAKAASAKAAPAKGKKKATKAKKDLKNE